MEIEIKTKFQIVPKQELRTLFLEYVADAEMSLKRCKTHGKKRHYKRVIQIFGSASAYLTELMENENQQ